MTIPQRLHLYEEITLLALRDEKGTLTTSFAAHLVAGAVLAELLLGRRITAEDSKKRLLDLHDTTPTGDPVIDECLARMAAGRRRAAMQTWLPRLADIKDLCHKAARQLCRRGILRADEDRVLLLFTRRIYPEMDPAPEREIVERMRAAVFADADAVDPRTAVLIALAHAADLLGGKLGRKELRARKKRIEQIVKGELVGRAAKEVIDACRAAVVVAAIVPVIAATSASHH
jgi:hypothetical protein